MRKHLISIIILGIMSLMSACNKSNQDGAYEILQNSDKNMVEPLNNSTSNKEDLQILEEFYRLLKSKHELKDTIKFVDDNISKMSKVNAGILIDNLIDEQKLFINDISKDFVEENIQKELRNNIKIITHPETNENEKLSKLIIKAKNLGYKIVSDGDNFTLILDYSFLERHKKYTTDDIKEYINILKVESDQIVQSDLSFVVTWDEILNRAYRQERFLNHYSNSKNFDKVEKLYHSYVDYCLFGALNTPLFSRSSHKMEPFAKNKYFEFIERKERSKFVNLISDYCKLIKENNFTLSNTIIEFQQNNQMTDYSSTFGDFYKYKAVSSGN